MAILRNAIVDSQSNYTTITQVMDAVSNGNVELGIVDAFATKGYNAALKERSLKIYKILDLQSGYGVVLSGEFKRLEDDMRSYVSSNQAHISLFVEKKIGILQVISLFSPMCLRNRFLKLFKGATKRLLVFDLVTYTNLANGGKKRL